MRVHSPHSRSAHEVLLPLVSPRAQPAQRPAWSLFLQSRHGHFEALLPVHMQRHVVLKQQHQVSLLGAPHVPLANVVHHGLDGKV